MGVLNLWLLAFTLYVTFKKPIQTPPKSSANRDLMSAIKVNQNNRRDLSFIPSNSLQFLSINYQHNHRWSYIHVLHHNPPFEVQTNNLPYSCRECTSNLINILGWATPIAHNRGIHLQSGHIFSWKFEDVVYQLKNLIFFSQVSRCWSPCCQTCEKYTLIDIVGIQPDWIGTLYSFSLIAWIKGFHQD